MTLELEVHCGKREGGGNLGSSFTCILAFR